MRPVDRGSAPPEAPFAAYGDAFNPLADRLGRYCSYCERPVPVSLAVEHVRPKSLEPGLELEWTNFLLGCTNCNSTKSDKPVVLSEFLWPDLDNTADAFNYQEGIVSVNEALGVDLQHKAEVTLTLTGLDRFPGAAVEPTPTDKRWKDRLEALVRAQRCQEMLSTEDTVTVRELILMVAVTSGFWSIWYGVFADDPVMRQALIERFPGTSADCFDATSGFDCAARPGGQL